MSNNQKVASSSFPLLSIMFLIFMTLKLTGHIDWSWWWVTAPLWGIFPLILVIFVLAFVVYGVKALVSR